MNDVKKHQIFIVDDSQIQLILLEKVLTKEGFSVRSFLNGFKLIKALEDQRPDLIISDIDMPVLDGFDLMERVRKKSERTDIPFFLLSSKNNIAIRRKAERAGAQVFLPKPFKYQALVDVVKERIGTRV